MEDEARRQNHEPKPTNWNKGSLVINSATDPIGGEKTYTVTNGDSRTFIGHIQKWRKRGYGFVPFIGAGFSAASGAPLVDELQSYLQRCILLALEPGTAAWHPRTDQWPPLIDRSGPEGSRDPGDYWKQVEKLQRNYWWEEILNQSYLTRNMEEGRAVRAQGFGSAAEWRTALLFLSRLDGERGAFNPSLGPPLQEIIDSCLRAVLKDKHPSLEHNMLAILAGALRFNLVLTTNFDDLLERAFAAARNPLEVFDVPLGDRLPHWSAVSEVRALVKLHGNRHSLRADYSLDALPSEEDKQRFLEYLLSDNARNKSEPYNASNKLDFQNFLLIMGFSGNDRRTLAFIEYAWRRLHKHFGVFWICHSDKDVETIRKHTEKFFTEAGDDNFKGSIILRHANLGLLLLQLYQTIRRKIPPFGGLFPSVSRLTLPPQPVIAAGQQLAWFSDGIKRVLNRLRTRDKNNQLDPPGTKLILATAPKPDSNDEFRGLTSHCSHAFRELERDNVCLWLDMNDISSTDNLFEVLLEAAYFRLGQENWVPVYRETEEDKRAKEIRRLARSVNRPWIIFLNARETPGANTDAILHSDDRTRPHGWMDDETPGDKADKSACTEKFLELLKQLCGIDSPHISVVLMCRELGSQPRLITKLYKEKLVDNTNHVKLEQGQGVDFSEESTVKHAIDWTADGEEDYRENRRRFLHALVLMQRPRFLATIWSNAASLSGEDPKVAGLKEDWLQELEIKKLIRRKAGGFIWMHLRCRQLIRHALEAHDGSFNLHGWKPWEQKADIHTGLAQWYEKILNASQVPSALFEALYHYCQAAVTQAKDSNLKKAGESLVAASALLRSHAFLIQTQGYARGNCRRLAHTRGICEELEKTADQPLYDAARELRIACTESMRAIAREVGEDAKAFLRHRQFALLHLTSFKREPLFKGEPLPEELGSNPDPKPQHENPPSLSQQLAKALAEQHKPDFELVRWYRWSGMLHAASRSYRQADIDFKCALEPAGDENCSQERLLEELRVREQSIDLKLLQHNLARRLDHLDAGPCSQGVDVTSIQEEVAGARELAAKIRNSNNSVSSYATMSANLCESRLLIQQSVCASLESRSLVLAGSAGQSCEDGRDDADQAMGLLGDAEVILHISDPQRHRPERAIVELHRAEARLHAAEKAGHLGEKWKCFAEMCQELEKLPPGNWKRLYDCLHPYLDRDPDREDQRNIHAALRRARSLVADGLRFLDRAEPVLRVRRRNVAWTTWFFERRLRLIAMSVWASIFDESGTPIPFLGLEAAPARNPSLADSILEDSVRMISVDAYRLATIIHAYASSAKALQIRLQGDDDLSAALCFRQQRMRNNLLHARKELQDAIQRRNDPNFGGRSIPERYRMDNDVLQYINKVDERAKDIFNGLEGEVKKKETAFF